MKINLNNAVIQKVQTMSDKTIQIRLGLQELPPTEMAKVFGALNSDIVEVDFDIPKDESQGKSPSQRLRGALYVLFSQQENVQSHYKDFEVFYRAKMEDFIGAVKERLT